MPTRPGEAVDTLRRRTRNGKCGGCDEDRELLLAFRDDLKLRRQDYGYHRHEKLLRHLARISENAEVCMQDSILEVLEGDVDETVALRWSGWNDLETFLNHYCCEATEKAQARERAKVEWL